MGTLIKPQIYLVICDQNPQLHKTTHQAPIEFFNRQINYIDGYASVAIKFNIPIIYLHIQRPKRGYYEYYFSTITTDASQLTKADICQIFYQYLEKDIIQQPENWLWFHKRFKRSITY